jgi:hypothetical protein
VDNQCRPLVRDPVEHLPGVAFRVQYGRAGGNPPTGYCIRNHKVCIAPESG